MNQSVESLTQSIHSNTMNHSRINGSMNESLNNLRNRFVHNTDSIISVRAVLNVIFSTAKLPDPSNYTSNLIQCSLRLCMWTHMFRLFMSLLLNGHMTGANLQTIYWKVHKV